MQNEHFKASTQYNDFKGTVAADRADQGSFSDFLRARGILKQDEIVKGISFFSAENFFDVEAYIFDQAGELRRETVKITLTDFFNTFKRFSIKLSRNGELDDQEIEFHVKE
ncbi:hypothetical protein [Klebsiella pneumoniae]|uniref:hypothetical protein n=1 Tax=Klebsiella pneumoniae TaxID=573 RepID=UPI002FF6F8F0|nr:hypothetical protein [Klebsiella pneumoniae]HBV7393851.1 hypothetical protein [Klebsiella pneumoniae]HBV7574818.1 hypothetical protein [Klebsiella pneumoniae]